MCDCARVKRLKAAYRKTVKQALTIGRPLHPGARFGAGQATKPLVPHQSERLREHP